jgi:hypothetical protein
MATKDDWRLTNQAAYLKGVRLNRQRYEPADGLNDHDHCEFCFAKFMLAGSDVLSLGYTTPDRSRWVCPACFDDFQEMFGWTVEG